MNNKPMSLSDLNQQFLQKQEDNLVRSTSTPQRVSIDDLIRIAKEQEEKNRQDQMAAPPRTLTLPEIEAPMSVNVAGTTQMRNYEVTHVKITDTSDVQHIIKKELIDMVKYDPDYDEAEVIIKDYDDIEISAGEYKKLSRELV